MSEKKINNGWGEWKEVRLGDYVESISETYKFSKNKKVIFLNTSDILFGKVLKNSMEDSNSLPGQAKKRIKKGDFLFSEIRPANGRYALVDFDANNYIVSTKLMVLRCNSKIDINFFRLYLTSKDILDYLQMLAEDRSGTFPQITFNDISNLYLLLPPLPEQKAIAEVLSSLDDKIDLLHRQNKTLEQMAETLYRRWFVVEAKEDWEILKLSEIAEVKNGFSFSSKSYIENEPNALEVLKMGHIEKGGGLRTNPKRNYAPRNEKLKRYILNKGDIVMAMTDMKDNVVILGVPAMIDKSDHYVLNQRVARIYLKSNHKLMNNYLLYIQLKDKENIAILQSKANSGVQVNLSTQTIKDIEIIVPPLQIQQKKGQTIEDLYLRKENNDNQIRTLEKLRDTLLPKLMSGEVRVKM